MPAIGWGWAIGISACLLGGGFAALVFHDYRRDIRRAHERISVGSQSVETRYGRVEYGVSGDGPPVLAVHGAGGGFDQGLEVGKPLTERGFRVIAMSRFGYLGTPLPVDASPAAQADAHACLLDALGIERVAIVGASAGAPSSMQFALRHPERTTALILLVPAAYPFHFGEPVSDTTPGRDSATMKHLIVVALKSDFFFWLTLRIARHAMVRGVLGTAPSLLPGSSRDERMRIAQVLDHIQPVSRRRLGLVNDLSVVRTLPRYDLERIAVPTLVIGVEDCLYGTYPGARHCAESIPGARFASFPRGGHLWIGHEKEVTDEIVSFLRST